LTNLFDADVLYKKILPLDGFFFQCLYGQCRYVCLIALDQQFNTVKTNEVSLSMCYLYMFSTVRFICIVLSIRNSLCYHKFILFSSRDKSNSYHSTWVWNM